jgi:tellurite resistance protein
VFIVSHWLSSQHQIAHATPAWILPVVGLLDLPLAVPHLSVPELDELMLVGLAIGLFFAIPLFTLIFSRLVFEPPMPTGLQPTLMILVTPFAVGMSAYVATTGQVDPFAKSLYVLTIFFLLVLLGRLRNLGSCCPFRFAWWAISFPLAASTIASLRFAESEPAWITWAIAASLVAASTLVIAWLLVKTVLGVIRGEVATLSS